MLNKLKADFDGILELVNKCPAALQDTALKTILEHWFSNNATPPARANTQSNQDGGGVPPPASGMPDAVKPFVNAHGISADVLGKVFQPVGPGAQLMVTVIPGRGKFSQQVHLACLLCVRQALETGTFTCTLKDLREMCVHYNCYDSANFSNALKTYKNLFKPRSKGADLDLSGPGLKKAGELIKNAKADNE